MSITIESTRFGMIEIPHEAVIEFPAGLIGLGGTRYALLAGDEESAFVWLHSVEDPALALPLTKPWQFFPSYEVVLSEAESQRIGLTDPAAADVYVTVSAAEALEDFRVNLRAPIVISAGRGFQVINEAPDAPVRAPLFSEVPASQVA